MHNSKLHFTDEFAGTVSHNFMVLRAFIRPEGIDGFERLHPLRASVHAPFFKTSDRLLSNSRKKSSDEMVMTQLPFAVSCRL